MNITLNTAIGNNNYIHINKSNNIRYTQTNLLNRTNACDEVSFTGAKKNNIPKNEHDQVYCKVIARDLKLNKEQTEILFKTVADFLEENGYESLRDIYCEGEENYDKMGSIEAVLQGRIYENLGYNDEYSQEIGDFIATETVNRIDKGDDYVTTGLKRASVPALKELFTNNRGSDIAFFKAVKTYLNLTPTQLFDFQTIVEKALDEPDLIYVNDIIPFDYNNFKNDNFDAEPKFPQVMKELQKKFNLSTKEEKKIKNLFEMRTRFKNFETEQALRILKLQDDIPTLIKIMDVAGYNDGTIEKRKFCNNLINLMMAAADKNEYTNLFEIFKKENLSAGKAQGIIDFIYSSNLSQENKGNLILDLIEASRIAKPNKDETIVEGNGDASIRSEIMANKLCETFGIIKNNYTINDMSKAFKQLYPAYITNKDLALRKDLKMQNPVINTELEKMISCLNVKGNEETPAEVAYKLAEKYNLPNGAEKTIIKIINDAKELSKNDLWEYIITKEYYNDDSGYDDYDDYDN